jgi:3-oxoacyl-[acyl-carrier protein] reductase
MSNETQVILITGASSGIGQATALEFAAHGWHVVGTARSLPELDDTISAVNALPDGHGEFLPLVADVRDAEAQAQVVADTLERFGRLDAVVANAGVGHRGGIVDAEWKHVQTVLDTNIAGALHTIRAAVPALRQRKRGHVIIITSVTYNMVVPYAAYYAASKAFISSIGRALRYELADDNIQVLEMIVGRTATAFNANRLGGERTGNSVSSMTPERVAAGMRQAVMRNQRLKFLRVLDRLTVWANVIVPDIIARIAMKDYR